VRRDEGLARSVHVRLVRHARAIGMDPNFVLGRFAVERFLYRLSKSRHAERFVLKGAMLMLVWLGETLRPTRDLDLLGSGDLSEPALTDTLAEVCSVVVDPDGIEFQPETIEVEPIRVEDVYGGMRARMLSLLGNARLCLQIDVGVGDAVSPQPEWLDYPSLLDLPAPHVLAYRPETAISEKLHAMVTLGETNSRMRDFFETIASPGDSTSQGKCWHAPFGRRSRGEAPRFLQCFPLPSPPNSGPHGASRCSGTHSFARAISPPLPASCESWSIGSDSSSRRR
jgi:hypothetical protein